MYWLWPNMSDPIKENLHPPFVFMVTEKEKNSVHDFDCVFKKKKKKKFGLVVKILFYYVFCLRCYKFRVPFMKCIFSTAIINWIQAMGQLQSYMNEIIYRIR